MEINFNVQLNIYRRQTFCSAYCKVMLGKTEILASHFLYGKRCQTTFRANK